MAEPLTLNPPEALDGHLWTLRELAAVIGVTPDSLRQRIARGTLVARKYGGSSNSWWLVDAAEATRVVLGKRSGEYVSADEIRRVHGN